ncbi:LOW QUALITY PROTEIN: transport associated protein, partial [Streptomyces sp. C]
SPPSPRRGSARRPPSSSWRSTSAAASGRCAPSARGTPTVSRASPPTSGSPWTRSRPRRRRPPLPSPRPLRSPAAPVAPPAPAAPPAPVAAPVGGGKINLDKGRVSLQKNQTVSLVKGGRPLLSQVKMGLGWEPAYGGRDIDLDASVIAYGPQRNFIDSCYFGKLSILGGAIKHSGDNLTGDGAGDDEVIVVDLGRLPAEATGLVFTVNSFSGQKFTEVAKAYCRLIDAASGEELVRFDLTSAEPQTGVMMAKLIKQFSGEWEMTAMGEFVKSRTVRGMVKPASQAL